MATEWTGKLPSDIKTPEGDKIIPIAEPNSGGTTGFARLLPWNWKERLTPEQMLIVQNGSGELNNGGLLDIPPTFTKEQRKLLLGDAYILTDVLPHNLRDGNPMTRENVEQIMKWANHPEVAGHIYQLENDTSKLRIQPWEYFLMYYRGEIDDEGNSTNSKDSTFFKGIHGSGEDEDMLSNLRMRWAGVPFVDAAQTAYWERVITRPDMIGLKIGLAFGYEVLLNAYYKYDGYGRGLHLPARAVRATTYADRTAKGWERNEEFHLALGFEHHKEPKTVDGRRIQPWENKRASFERIIPDALTRIAKDQPERSAYLTHETEILQRELHDRSARE